MSKTGKSISDRTDWYLGLEVRELGVKGEGGTVKRFGVWGSSKCYKVDCDGYTTLWIQWKPMNFTL